MKKSCKVTLLITAALTLCVALSAVSFASETNPDTYVYVPVKTGVEAVALFSNSTADSGTDATITEDANGDVALTFGDGSTDWKRTVVDLDISDVANERFKYVSFDITLDSLMNLVISLDPYDVTQDLENRPHSLYFTDTGYMASTQHPRKIKYISRTDADGYNGAITGSWWTSTMKITQPYSPDTSVNVTIVASSLTGTGTALSNGVKRFESDEVQIYINGERKGQLNTGNRLDSWNSNVLSFSHYSDLGKSQTVYLKNLEIGYCRTSGLDEAYVLNPDEENKTWEFPEGQNTFISLTLPTNSDNAYFVQTSTGDCASMLWFKDMGVIANWGSGFFNSDGTSTKTHSEILGWNNIPVWKNSTEVTVTFEIDRLFGTISVYDNLGHWRKAYETIPEYVTITDVVGDVKPTRVVSGMVVRKGLHITDSTGEGVSEFGKDTGVLNLSAFGQTDKIPMAIYAWYDVDGDLIEAETRELNKAENGLFAISSASGFGSSPPTGAESMKIFMWDNDIRPIYNFDSAEKIMEEYSIIQSYEVEALGRYRVYGTLDFTDASCEGNVFAVSKNGERVWEQLVTVGEPQILDIRIFADEGDVIDVYVGADSEIAYDYSTWSCDISRYLGISPICEASTSVGHSYRKQRQMTFASLIGSEQGANGSEFYSLKLGVKYPMTYDATGNKWRSSISGDDGSIGGDTVYPGSEWTVGSDSVMEYTVASTGTLRIDGDLYLYDSESDGVLANIYLNDKLLWSNRVGGMENMRWDDPFDVHYFSDEANVVANVKRGDVLKFTFNRWRKAYKDWLSTENVTLTYVKGNILSKTTKWKLSRSIVVNAETGIAHRNDVDKNVDVLYENGAFYVAEKSIFPMFGEELLNKVSGIEIDGISYLPVKELAEANSRYTAEVDDKVIIIHKNIPVFYGFAEISEIRTALENGTSLF
ncbi:MAG: hypothetical protein E7415_05850 [Ruminococcaceae bacterium]|nr:hypothetical protein [Oscillospiraceae bacterium]